MVLGLLHTRIHDRMKVISRNQVCAWFKNQILATHFRASTHVTFVAYIDKVIESHVTRPAITTHICMYSEKGIFLVSLCDKLLYYEFVNTF